MIFEDSNHPFASHTQFDQHHAMLEGAFAQHAQLSHRDDIRNPELLGRRASDDPLDPFHSSLGSQTSPRTTGKVLTWASTREDIIVTGVRHTQNSDDGGGYDGTGSYGDSGGIGSPGGSGGGGGYTTSGVSAAANAFADAHIHNQGTTSLDKHVYERAHDDLAKLYELSRTNPSAPIDLGHNVFITAGQAISELNGMTLYVVDTPVPQGAGTQPNANYSSATIWLNPQNPGGGNFVNWVNNNGDTGIDFTVYHELGHAIYDLVEQAQDTEAMADAAAFSMMNTLGISTPPPNAVGDGFDY